MKKTTFVKGLATGDFNEPGESPREHPRVLQALDTLGREVDVVKEEISTLAFRLGMVMDFDPKDLWHDPSPTRESVVRMEGWVHEILTQVEVCASALGRITNSLHI